MLGFEAGNPVLAPFDEGELFQSPCEDVGFLKAFFLAQVDPSQRAGAAMQLAAAYALAAAAEQMVAGDRDVVIRLLAVASDLADRAWWMTGAVTARWLRAALNQC